MVSYGTAFEETPPEEQDLFIPLPNPLLKPDMKMKEG